MKKIFSDKYLKETGQKGFSLIEMMVVVVIMAILAAVAIPIYKNNQIDAYAPEAEAVIYAYSMAAQRYRAYNGNSFSGMTKSGAGGLQGPPYNVVETTTNWTFALSGVGVNTFTLTASGNIPALSGKTITFSYDATVTPSETKTYNW